MGNRAKQVEELAAATKVVSQKSEPIQQTHVSGSGPVLQPRSARVQPSLSGPADILAAHQTIGNQAVMRLLDKQRSVVQAKDVENSEESVQLQTGGQREPSNAEIHSAAARGISTPATTLPFLDRIQASFGRYSIGHIKAHVGPEAAQASRDMNALAFASGDHVVFGGKPDLHTAAHEAAHVVQQQAGVQLPGGVGQAGDAYEKNADAVADIVVGSGSAARLLDPFAASPAVDQPQVLAGTISRENLDTHVAPIPLAPRVGQYSTIVRSDGIKIQRRVQVGDDVDLKNIWKNVKDYVESPYGRRKKLESLYIDPDLHKFEAYDELADFLHSNFKSRKKGRARPSWAPGITKKLNATWGGKRHRRHIIMSSLMREAVYAVTDEAPEKADEKYKVYVGIAEMAGLKESCANLEQAESCLVKVLHNNPANLELDSGAENSAIGSLAHSFGKVLGADGAAIENEFKEYTEDHTTYFKSKISGFEQDVQKTTIADVITFPKVNNLDDFIVLMESLYDSFSFDILTNKSKPDTVAGLIGLHGRFLNARDNKHLGTLSETAEAFVKLGLVSNPSYKDIW